VLPDWLDPQTLQWAILGALVMLVLLALMILRFFRRLVVKTVLVAAIAGLGMSLWAQRADLGDCVQTCECSLYGKIVRVDYASLPTQVRDRIDSGDAGVCEGLTTTG